MRKMSVICDVCGGSVEKFNGAVTLASWGTIHKDACSPKCLASLLHGFAADIEKREGMKAADNIAFAAKHPEATKLPEAEPATPSPPAAPPPVSEPALAGCAACDAGVPINTENDFKHTGEGKLCKAVRGQGPCACAPSNWKMVPNDTSTPGPREVTCQACGNVWESMIRSPAKEAEAAAAAPTGKKRSRPKTKTETNGQAPSTTEPPLFGAETPENKTERDKKLGRTPPPDHDDELAKLKANPALVAGEPAPRWCGCGRPLVFTKPTGPNDMGRWECEQHGISSAIMGVKEGRPMENLSQLLTDIEKLGMRLNLVDVAGWSIIKRDMLRAWIEQPEAGPPAFLLPEPEPELAPEPAKYTF